MKFLATASVLLFTLVRASGANGPFRANMTVTRFRVILVNGDLSGFYNGGDLRSGFVSLRLTRYGTILSSVVGRCRTDLIAVGRRPFTLTILADRARAINVKIKDRCGIHVCLLNRNGNREGDFYVFQVQEGGNQRISILGRLLERYIGILGSPRLRELKGRRRANAVGQDVSGLRVLLALSSFQIGQGNLSFLRVCLIGLFASSFGRQIYYIRYHTGSLSILYASLIRLFGSALIVEDRRLYPVVPMYLMAVMFFEVI